MNTWYIWIKCIHKNCQYPPQCFIIYTTHSKNQSELYQNQTNLHLNVNKNDQKYIDIKRVNLCTLPKYSILGHPDYTPYVSVYGLVLDDLTRRCQLNPYNAEIFVYKAWRSKGFFQFKIIINVLVSSFWVIWIPMLWVYDLYKYFNSVSTGTVFIRQNLTSRRQILMYEDGPRFERVKHRIVWYDLNAFHITLSLSSW